MATKADFSQGEWARVLASPMVVGTAITAADPSGLWGIMKEGMAGGWALLQAKQDANANALVKAVADDLAAGEGRTLAREHVQTLFTGARVSDVKERAIGELRNVAAVLDTKAPADMRWRSKRGFERLRRRPQRLPRRGASLDSVASPSVMNVRL